MTIYTYQFTQWSGLHDGAFLKWILHFIDREIPFRIKKNPKDADLFAVFLNYKNATGPELVKAGWSVRIEDSDALKLMSEGYEGGVIG